MYKLSVREKEKKSERARASVVDAMRCRRIAIIYLRDVHAEESVKVAVSRQGALASLVINSSAKSDHIQAVVGLVHLWQHIHRLLFCLGCCSSGSFYSAMLFK